MADIKLIATYNKLGKNYLNKLFKRHPIEIDAFMKLLPKGAKILDAGCAAGRDTKIFKDNGFDPVGIDLSEVFLEEGKRKFPDVTFKRMDVSDLEFPPESFRAIWAHAVLGDLEREEVPDTLIGFFRILKPGGLLHIRVKEGLGEEDKGDELTGGVKKHVRYFTKGEMKRLLKNTGFRILILENLPSKRGIKWLKVWAQK